MVEKEKVIEALKKCMDPEINLDVYTLGLIYDITIEGGLVKIKMTFTSIGCPYGPQLLEDVIQKVKNVEGVEHADVDVVFDPPWEPSEEVKMILGVG